MATRVSKPKRHPPTEAPKALERATWLQKQWLPPLLLMLAMLAVFAPVCGSEFVAWDDPLNVSKNPSFNPPTFATVGRWVEGEIWIGIDPFFYKERLNQTPGMPDLFVDWSVTRIQLETTPWIEDVSSGRKLRMRDTEHESWADRASTDAWTDDGGGADYLLSLSR